MITFGCLFILNFETDSNRSKMIVKNTSTGRISLSFDYVIAAELAPQPDESAAAGHHATAETVL